MTDPTTLSAAELDEWEQFVTPRADSHGLTMIQTAKLAKLVFTARRTEAAERKLAKIEAECSRLEFAGGRGTVSCDFIRRALKEHE